MFFNECKFKYEFRDYQKRALEEIHRYMEDDKIHVVAAPGAGKTILALQIMIEVGNPTLICVPTVALREQWKERLKEDFYEGKDISNIISTDILNPNTITVCTYQSIYSAYRNKEEVNEQYDDGNDKPKFKNNAKSIDLIKLLKDKNISTIILDEAHHLKTAWWKALISTIDKLGKTKIISLTATPPYDVKNSDWKKYIELCGDIDAEILIPELVKTGDLCPHQDYIYFNYPEETQLNQLNEYKKVSKKIYDELCNNNQFITAISLHPGVINTDEKIDYFLENFDYFISILSFLNYKKNDIQDKDLFKYLKDIPEFDLKQMETLLTNALFGDKNSYKDFEKLFKEIKSKLNEIGAIEDSKVNLIYTKNIKKMITQNIGKLNSINEIVQNEYKTLEDNLKLVIITDYIKDDIYEIEEESEISVIGAIPIFKNILKYLENNGKNMNIAVLTGKIVIIPTHLKEKLLDICREKRIDTGLINIYELKYDFDYSKVVFNGNSKKEMVIVITKLFESSNIHVLIGTNALIGEGWDAPFINSLIMASFVGSFVTSNQIRGRAIRKNKYDKYKSANIWHLVCIEKEKDKYILGSDFEVLERRFEAFEGIFLHDNKIDKGIYRLNIDKSNINSKKLDELNNIMIEKSTNRKDMADMWIESVKSYIPIRKQRILPEECNPSIKQYKNRVIMKKSTSICALILILLNIESFLIQNNTPIKFIILCMIIYAGYKLIINSNINWISKNMGKALLKTLIEMDKIEEGNDLKLMKEKDDIFFYIKNGTTKDKSVFNESLKEMLSSIDIPRYLLKIEKSYYQVPSIIGKNKTWVEILKRNLKRKFGNVKIIYTKSPNGKKELLNIKLNQLSKKKHYKK